jgi:hypothetical protein
MVQKKVCVVTGRRVSVCDWFQTFLDGCNTLTVRSQCAGQAHYTRVRLSPRAATPAQDRNRQHTHTFTEWRGGARAHVALPMLACYTRCARITRAVCAHTLINHQRPWSQTRRRSSNNRCNASPRLLRRSLCAAYTVRGVSAHPFLVPHCGTRSWPQNALVFTNAGTMRILLFQAHHNRAPV